MDSENIPKKCACSHGKWAVIILAVLLVSGIVCFHLHHPPKHHPPRPLEPPMGSQCTVQFRRDILGGDFHASPLTGNINGMDVSLSGELIGINRENVLLRQADKDVWIPRENVLLIQCDNPEKKP